MREDKEREAGDGFDGTWVAHPDLVPVAMAESSTGCSATGPTRSSACARTSRCRQRSCSTSPSPAVAITEAGVRAERQRRRCSYLDAWLRGNGAAAIDNLMEDAATAEISPLAALAVAPPRRRCSTTAGRSTTAATPGIRDEELDRIGRDTGRVAEAAALLDELVLADDFPEFLTLEAYRRLD